MNEDVALEMIAEFEKTPFPKRGALLARWSSSMSLTTLEWLQLNGLSYHLRFKAWSSAKAFEQAKTLADYVALASRLYGNDHKHRAYDEILKFDVTSDADIALLYNSGSVRLSNIGWYLAGRKKVSRAS